MGAAQQANSQNIRATSGGHPAIFYNPNYWHRVLL
jgi:hypothetical protein